MNPVHVYIASCASDGGIYHYVLQDQMLVFREKVPCDRPMYMDLHPDRVQVLLRAPFSECSESGLLTFMRTASGSFIPEPTAHMISTRGQVACHLCHWQGETYAANYISGSIFASNGSLAVHTGSGPNLPRQDGPHTHFVYPAPDGACLFAVDLGTDTVYGYDPQLNLLHTAQVPKGHGARHLAYSEDGKTVFCVNELASTVTVFAYHRGKLTPKATVPVLNRPSDSIAAAIRVRDNWVFVSNRGDDSISSLYWDGENLTLKHVTPCGGVFPRDFLIVQNLLLCANERSDQVSVFRVNGGNLIDTGIRLDIDAPLCIVASEASPESAAEVAF